MPSFKVYKGSANSGIQEAQTSKPALTGDQALIKITASGLCGTDLHYQHADMVLGHEGTGIVVDIGPGAVHIKKGDRVGWGYQTNSCGFCEKCLTGNEQYCPEKQLYGEKNLDQGSLAEAAIWSAKFLIKLPQDLTDVEAAPLMCGGGTVWTALRQFGLSSTATVGILGFGGLGHLAIQFAAKMGMNVIVFSTTDGKKEDSLRLGASQFVVTKDKETLDIGSSKLDALLSTSSVALDWNLYLPLLKPQAVIIPLTVHFTNFTIPQFSLIGSGYRVQGSVIASRNELNKMLEFAARHGVKPITHLFKLNKEGIESSIKTLNEGKMRYRGVLVAE
jgi:D-arabinose 1-dehydrogenase-like Zn-dependent alcohol dehydrogenase